MANFREKTSLDSPDELVYGFAAGPKIRFMIWGPPFCVIRIGGDGES
jgi:hypothetical protein